MKLVFVAATALVASLALSPAVAQQSGPNGGGGGGMGGGTVGPGGQFGSRSLSSDEFNKLQDYAEQARRLTKEEKESGKTVEQLLAEDKAFAAQMAKAMPLACEVNEAMLAAEGPTTGADGREIKTKTYEVTCANGMGYFLISLDPGTPYGISCFAADTARQVDVKAGRKPAPACSLPPNANVLTMAATLMTRAGKPCTVKDYRWLGQSSAAHTEYDEVQCSDDTGYVMAIALPGSLSEVRVAPCNESAKRGLPCKLSDNGNYLTVATFRDGLQKKGISCDASDNDIAVLGQETARRRYVVEFRCSQRPTGLVAYFPGEGSTAPFEVADCKAALKKSGAVCKLNKPQ